MASENTFYQIVFIIIYLIKMGIGYSDKHSKSKGKWTVFICQSNEIIAQFFLRYNKRNKTYTPSFLPN